MTYHWEFAWVWRNWPALWQGMTQSALLVGVTVALGTVAAFVLALMRLSRVGPVQWLARGYIELFRNLPVLVVLFWLFYCLPIFVGQGARLPAFWVAVVGLGLNYSAMQAETYRAGVEAIPPGELEVARALRFGQGQIALGIILPQAFWRTLAPTLGQVVNTLKFSSLASFITVGEVFYQTQLLINQTNRPLEFYTALAVLYLLLILPLSLAVQVVEKRLQERYARH